MKEINVIRLEFPSMSRNEAFARAAAAAFAARARIPHSDVTPDAAYTKRQDKSVSRLVYAACLPLCVRYAAARAQRASSISASAKLR